MKPVELIVHVYLPKLRSLQLDSRVCISVSKTFGILEAFYFVHMYVQTLKMQTAMNIKFSSISVISGEKGGVQVREMMESRSTINHITSLITL